MTLPRKISLKDRILFTLFVSILLWANLLWDHFHEGVPAHYILHRKDLPRISNWWGGIAVPLITWISVYRTAKRVNQPGSSDPKKWNKAVFAFIGSLLFGILLSYFFTIGSEIPDYMMIGAIIGSLFIPIYRAEYLLGFILAMTYTFGGILPLAAALFFLLVGLVNYELIRRGVLFLYAKIVSK